MASGKPQSTEVRRATEERKKCGCTLSTECNTSLSWHRMLIAQIDRVHLHVAAANTYAC